MRYCAYSRAYSCTLEEVTEICFPPFNNSTCLPPSTSSVNDRSKDLNDSSASLDSASNSSLRRLSYSGASKKARSCQPICSEDKESNSEDGAREGDDERESNEEDSDGLKTGSSSEDSGSDDDDGER